MIGFLVPCVLHSFRPDLINFEALNPKNPAASLNNAFDVAEKELGIARLLDPEGRLPTPSNFSTVIAARLVSNNNSWVN